ncbi:Flp family type IVb pilin [Enterobacteriaceae bacterium ESL0689]|nr:Flp family type IVb pilin [Enterobacteriaceae bacterium ESL0689]
MLTRVYNKYLAACANVATNVNEFKKNEQGVTAIEYAIVVAGVAAVVMVIFGSGGTVETMLNDIFTKIKDKIITLVA